MIMLYMFMLSVDHDTSSNVKAAHAVSNNNEAVTVHIAMIAMLQEGAWLLNCLIAE